MVCNSGGGGDNTVYDLKQFAPHYSQSQRTEEQALWYVQRNININLWI